MRVLSVCVCGAHTPGPRSRLPAPSAWPGAAVAGGLSGAGLSSVAPSPPPSGPEGSVRVRVGCGGVLASRALQATPEGQLDSFHEVGSPLTPGKCSRRLPDRVSSSPSAESAFQRPTRCASVPLPGGFVVRIPNVAHFTSQIWL